MSRRVPLLLLTGIALCGTVLSAQDTLPREDRSRLADGLYSRKLFDLALSEYEKLLAQDPPPGNAEVLAFRAAESARQLGNREAAARYYLQTLSLAPESGVAQRARYRLAEQAFSESDTQEAGGYLRELLTARPDPALEAPARYLLGQVLEADGQVALALNQYRMLLRNTPEDDLAGYAALRVATLGGGSVEERRRAYRLGLERASGKEMQVEALWGLAALETSEQNFETAADLYWELWTRFPDQIRVREGMIYLAWAQLQAERFERALTLYEETSETRRAAYPDTWAYLRAVSLQRLDRPEEALEAYEEILTATPDSRFRAVAGYEAAALHAAAGRHAEVLRYAEEISQVSGREADGLWMLAESARAQKQTAQAIRSYTRLIRDFPESPRVPDARYLRAMLQHPSEPVAAAGELEDFARLHPEDPRAAEALAFAGELMMRQEDLNKAYSLWRQALRISGDPDPDLLRRTAMAAIKLERDGEAQQLLEQVLSLNLPESEQAESRYWQGILLERTGETEAATEAYRRALTAAPDAAAWTVRGRMRLGRLYQLAGREIEALETFLPLIGRGGAPPLPDSLLLWMLDLAESEERWQALVSVGQELQTAKRNANAREIGAYAKARGLERLERLPEAVAAWRRGLDLESGSADAAEAALAAGNALLTLNRAEEAMPVFARAAEIGSALERGRFQAEALAGMGRAERARGNWEAAGRHFLSVSVLFDDPVLIPFCLQAAADAFDKAGQSARADAARRELRTRYPDAVEAAATPEPEETP